MSKPVVIRFVGDESRFKATTEAVGGRLRGFGKQAEEEGRRAGEGFDRAAEGADNAEGKAQGFASTLTGTKDVMDAVGEIGRGNLFEGFVLAGQGAADLAEGLNYTVIPAAKAAAGAFTRSALTTARDTAAKVTNAVVSKASAAATKAMTIAQWALNVAMRANPIGIVITVIMLLVAAVILAYKRSETFRNIVNAAFRAVLGAARALGSGAVAAFNALVAGGGRIISFFRELPGRIVSFLAGLPGRMLDLGKRLIRAYIDGIKSMAGAIISTISNIIPGPIKKFLHLGSPAEEGPLSKDGGPEAWGEKLSRLYVKGLERGGAGIAGPLGGLAGVGVGALAGAGGMSVTVHAATNADAAEIAREVAWTMKTSGR